MDSVIFDLDGTLLDSMYIWYNAGKIYLKNLGVEADDGLVEKMLPLTLCESAGYIKDTYLRDMPVEEIAIGLDRAVEDAYFNHILPKKGARELLAALDERRVKMTIATATDRYLVTAALKRLDMERYISRIFTCGEVGIGKKDGPEIYLEACASMGSRPEKCWVFEDMPHAARTAKGANFLVAGVKDTPCKDREARLRKTCDLFFDSLAPAESVISALEDFMPEKR